jgi:hypothetical protein
MTDRAEDKYEEEERRRDDLRRSEDQFIAIYNLLAQLARQRTSEPGTHLAPPSTHPVAERSGAFQFTCPQGHLLECEPAYAGMQSQCPTCGTLFIIPQLPAPSAGPVYPVPQPPAPASEPVRGDPAEDRIVHLLCPNGHELETPLSIVGSDAMCPECSAEFRLRYEDSREYKEEKWKERERREAAFGSKALHWAIVTAALVTLLLLGLIVAMR